jgi:hypothetical protein
MEPSRAGLSAYGIHSPLLSSRSGAWALWFGEKTVSMMIVALFARGSGIWQDGA